MSKTSSIRTVRFSTHSAYLHARVALELHGNLICCDDSTYTLTFKVVNDQAD